MTQQRTSQTLYSELDLQIALFDIQSKRVKSQRRAASIYNVPRTTLQDRRAGKRSRRDCEANSKRLTKLEEEAIVGRILEESTRGFAPTKADVRAMADKLLHEREGNPVGKNWVDNFVKRTPELRVGASGRQLPPFIIFAGKVLIDVWFKDLPTNWVLEVSLNGWTNNQLALAWLEHFDTHTKRHTVGGYRLLIIDGHESHCSVEFQDLCKEKDIILLCMPAHSSHLLQSLDVACFSPLKRKYGDAVSSLARNRTNYISKETFLPAFKAAFEQSITKENIQAGFRAAGLVPHDPQAVLSKLDVVVQTPKQSPQRAATWEAQTPRNACEVEAQSTLIRQRVRNRPGSSASSLDEKIAQLSKGAQQIAHEMVLLREKVGSLEAALDTATKRKSRKRRYVRTEETLNIGEVQEVLAEQADSRRGGGEIY
ncbi:hypothetical protein PtrM4_112190 [Pyrenophora tritici-repentis]|uniref:HTH CENPB-type domain-containing protein n=1 Tax=Pyrenophora tritici-repentis TaxID=45151 RepID=A0A834S015_9PLEO|nr:hypothetical protein PtrM4_112190 [Pyrenophora tritici-repentis]